jgi:hypothetical protein
MRRLGLTTVALIVGCAGGAAMREVIFPARAAAGAPTYRYKVVDSGELVKTVKARNRKFADADDREALEEGMNGFGRAGWRYVGCRGGEFCQLLMFEVSHAGAPAAEEAAPSSAPSSSAPAPAPSDD